MPDSFGQNITPDDNEILLAELRFSDPDRLPTIVQNSLPKLDESFYNFLEEKISTSADIQERDTLRTLKDAITDIMKTFLEQMQKQQREPGDPASSFIDVSSGGEDIATVSYDELIDQLAASDNMKVAVDAAYERVDLRLLERLGERIAHTATQDDSRLVQMRDTINAAMNQRMTVAMDSVKTVLAVQNADEMRETMDRLARKGKIDDAFILLLQANLEQAQRAGAEQATRVVKMVLQRATIIKELKLEPEIRLLRALLRTEDSAARIKMLTEGLKPKANVADEQGKRSTVVTSVDGKRFVTALRRLIEEFGNVDRAFVLRLSEIGEESEKVARKLFDMEGKDLRDLQNEAFYKRAVSVWDLEQIETREALSGRDAAWEGKLGPIPEGFNEDGKMQI